MEESPVGRQNLSQHSAMGKLNLQPLLLNKSMVGFWRASPRGSRKSSPKDPPRLLYPRDARASHHLPELQNTDVPKLTPCHHGEKILGAAAPERSRHWNKEVSPASAPASLLHSPEKRICNRQPGRAQTTPGKLLANSHLLALQKLRVASAVVGFLGSLRARDARCGTHW